MLHLLQQTVNPLVSLRHAVENWHDISMFLRENPRERQLQLTTLSHNLS